MYASQGLATPIEDLTFDLSFLYTPPGGCASERKDTRAYDLQASFLIPTRSYLRSLSLAATAQKLYF